MLVAHRILGRGGVKSLLLALLAAMAAVAGMTLTAEAQTDDGEAEAAQGRVIVRIHDRAADGVDDYRIEFGFFPEWALDDKDPWAEAVTTWSDWLPRARYLTKTVIDRRDADDNRRWLRSSLISVPAGAAAPQRGGDADLGGADDGEANQISGRVIARYSPDSRGRLRIEFGFLPECAFSGTANTEEAVERYGDDLLPSSRYLSASLISNRRGDWLRSSVVNVPPTCPSDEEELTIDITSPQLSVDQGEEVAARRIGTVEGPLTTEFSPITFSGLPEGLTIVDNDAGADMRRLVLSGVVDSEAELRSYAVRITARPPEGDAVSAELTIRVGRGDTRPELTWSGYSPDTQRVGGRVTLQQPRVVVGPGEPAWGYIDDTPRICTVDPSTGELALVAPGQCLVTAASAAGGGFRAGTIQTEVTVTDKPVPEIRWQGYSPLEAKVGEPAPRVLPPTARVAGRTVRLTYTYEVDEDSERDGICDVNSRNGQIDAMAQGSCAVVAKSAETDEYAAASSEPVRVAIVVEKQDPDLRWGGYNDENLRAGGDPIRPIEREPQPRLREARDQLTYSYSATPRSVCSVNPATGELTLHREGACEVTVRSEETDEFLADEVTVAVQVGRKGRPDLDWFDYPDAPVAVGGDPITPSRAGSRDRVGPLTYESRTPSVCSVDSRTGRLSGREPGTCRVTVMSGETDDLFEGSETITVRIIDLPLPSPCGLNYSRDVRVGGQVGPEIDCGDGDARARYETQTPTICSVNGNSGDVTGLAAGQCRIIATVPATSRYAEATPRATLAVLDDLSPRCDAIGDVGPLDPGESSRRINLDDYCEDPEEERLSYTAMSSDSGVATVRVSGSSLTVTASRNPGGDEAAITVIATDPGGKAGRTRFFATVDTIGPVIDGISCSPSSPSVDDDVTCTASLSGGTPTSYSWSGGDSSGSGVTYRTSFSTAGRKTVSLTVRNSAGSNSASTPSFSVGGGPPLFNSNNGISCSPSPPRVNDSVTCTASLSGGAPDSYSWSGGASSGSSATYRTSFSTAGSKTVSLTVRNTAGSDSDSISFTVAPPQLRVDSVTCTPSPATTNQFVTCTARVSGGGVDSYSWGTDPVFGSGVNSHTSHTFRFNNAGQYTVSLTVRNSTSSHTGSAALTVTGSDRPSCGNSDATVEEGSSTTLYYSCSDPDGDVLTFTATSSDTDVATVALSGTTVTVTGVSAGRAVISLWASDGHWRVYNSASVTVTAPTIVRPQVNSVSCSPSTTTVNANVTCTASLGGGTPTSYSWSGGASSGSSASYSASFSSAGSKTVSLTVSNSAGSDSGSTTVTVTPAGPRVDSIACTPSPATTNQWVTCTASLSGGAPDSYSWSTDPVFSSDVNSRASFLFYNRAQYTVSLTVRNAAGSHTGTAALTVTGSNRPGCGNSDATVEEGSSTTLLYSCSDPDGDVLTFTATSSDTSVATVALSGTTVTVTGVSAGRAVISLWASDGHWRVNNTGVVTVTAPTVVRPQVNSVSCSPSSPSVNASVTCTASLSGGTPTSYSWSGGASSGSSASYSTSFSSAGSKTVSLTVSNSAGSASRSTIVIVVGPPVVNSVSCSPSSPSVNASVTCTASLSGGTPTSYSWSGGASSGSSASYSTSFSSAGSKTVSLTVSNSAGSASGSTTVEVIARPYIPPPEPPPQPPPPPEPQPPQPEPPPEPPQQPPPPPPPPP